MTYQHTDNESVNELWESIMQKRMDDLAENANQKRIERGEEPLDVNP